MLLNVYFNLLLLLTFFTSAQCLHKSLHMPNFSPLRAEYSAFLASFVCWFTNVFISSNRVHTSTWRFVRLSTMQILPHDLVDWHEFCSQVTRWVHQAGRLAQIWTMQIFHYFVVDWHVRCSQVTGCIHQHDRFTRLPTMQILHHYLFFVLLFFRHVLWLTWVIFSSNRVHTSICPFCAAIHNADSSYYAFDWHVCCSQGTGCMDQHGRFVWLYVFDWHVRCWQVRGYIHQHNRFGLPLRVQL